MEVPAQSQGLDLLRMPKWGPISARGEGWALRFQRRRPTRSQSNYFHRTAPHRDAAGTMGALSGLRAYLPSACAGAFPTPHGEVEYEGRSCMWAALFLFLD
jgi:hypothetical protein